MAMPRWMLFEAIFFATCIYALWRGGAPERIASVTFLIAATLTLLVRRPAETQFESLEVGVMLVDVAVLAVMLALALLSERFWPIWMAAMAGITVLTHVSMLLNIPLMAWAYWRSEALWSYPMLLLLALAAARHQRRLRIVGTDPSWRRSSGR